MLKLYLILAAIFSLISFTVMRVDKSFAIKKKWRIPERTLLLLALPGPFGTYAAMLFPWINGRHKNRKIYFHLVVWLGLILHGVLVYFLLKKQG